MSWSKKDALKFLEKMTELVEKDEWILDGMDKRNGSPRSNAEMEIVLHITFPDIKTNAKWLLTKSSKED